MTTIAVVAHDAGGAEILSSYLRKTRIPAVLTLDGPALKIFERKLGTLQLLPLEQAIAKSSQVLCGTSWQSNLEFDAIQQAHATQKRSVAFIDHWVNYRERFVRSGVTCHPDEIWVGDEIAAKIAREEFAQVPVKVVGNPYLDDIQAELQGVATPHESSDGVVVLYVCEPVSEHALMRYGNRRHFGYVEEEALRFFLDNLDALDAKVARIRIRPHPSEIAGKYDWVVRDYDLPLDIVGKETLVQDIAVSDVVVGCESMAMVVGLLANKRVISCIPPQGPPCRLPHPQIEKLNEMWAAESARH
jgi:hypothetical protein